MSTETKSVVVQYLDEIIKPFTLFFLSPPPPNVNVDTKWGNLVKVLYIQTLTFKIIWPSTLRWGERGMTANRLYWAGFDYLVHLPKLACEILHDH